MQDQEETAPGTTNTESTQQDLIEKPHYHAVIVQDGNVKLLSDRVKAKLIRKLEAAGDYTMVSVIKGRVVQTRAKQTLELV